MMNASFKILPPQGNERLSYIEAYNDVVARKVDMCFVSHFQVINHFKDVSYTYPHESNSIVILMPTAKSLTKKKGLISIFGKYIWILLCVLIFTIFINLMFAEKFYAENNSYGDGFLPICAIMFSLPVHRFRKKIPLIKYQLFLFIVACMIFRTAFQCFVVSSSVSPFQVVKIKKISEVNDLDLKIYASQTLADLIPDKYHIKDQLFVIQKKERYHKIWNFDDPDVVFCLTSIQAEIILKKLKNGNKRMPYYIVKEALVPGFDNYFLQEHSPFTHKINDLLLRETQYGFDQILEYFDNDTSRNQTFSENSSLNMRHMTSAFVVWIIGLLISCFMLLLELRPKEQLIN